MEDKELGKVINTWKHIVANERGSLSRGMVELIVATVKQLERLKIETNPNQT